MPKVVIVGGGISGLSLAYRLHLAAPGTEIFLLEREAHAGGTIGTEHRDGFIVERGPNAFLDNKPFAWDLVHDLGLRDQLVEACESARRNRFLFLGDRLCALPTSPLGFLGSDVLNWHGKLSLLGDLWRRRAAGDRDESVEHLFRRRIGSEAAEVLGDALTTGIYAGDPRRLSLKACFPRLAEMERESGSLIRAFLKAARKRKAAARASPIPSSRGNQLWSLRSGLDALINRLCEALPYEPLRGVKVSRVLRRDEFEWSVEGEENDRWTADAVVLACPAYEQAAILADLDPVLAEQIGGISYNRLAVVALGYRREDVTHPLDGFGYLAPRRTRRHLLGVQWCSSIFPGRAPAGAVLLRAMCGGADRPEIVDWPEERLLQAVREELLVSMGINRAPVFHHVIRWERAIPQYHLGHLERVNWIEQRLSAWPGLFLGGNAYRGVALNDCVERGAELAAKVAGYLSDGRKD
jgi:protoporphyrinogen/coproporphyrinogen III oxidase